MNVLFLSELFYPHGGGAELATYLYAELLSEAGYDVVVVTNRFEGEEQYSKRKNLTVYRLPLFKSVTGAKYSLLSRLDVQFSGFMKKLVKCASLVYVPRLWYSMIPFTKLYKKPVIVHVHDYTPICPLAILYDSSMHHLCQKKTNCSARCVYQFERNKKSSLKDSVVSVWLNLFAKLPLQKCVEQADAIVCVSNAQREILIERMPTISRKTHVVYNPLPDVSPVRIDGDDFGYLGGFNPLKGFGVLCNSLLLLGDRSPKVHVTGASNLTESSRDRSRTELYDRIGLVFHERLKHSDQESFYRQIKGVIFPSTIPEPLPYITAEAMLRERLLIASNIGGVPEQVKGCKGVFLFEPGNYHELAEILNYTNGLDKDTAFELGYHNRQVFSKTFNNEKTIAAFERILNSLT